MKNEKWLPVAGYEGKYEVSDMGRVRSVDRVVTDVLKGTVRTRRFLGRVLSPHLVGAGYQSVCLSSGKGPDNRYIHRLVASTFVPNPEGKPQVNHINVCTTDNRASNLEWVTCSENHKHARLHGNVDGSNGAKLTSGDVKKIRQRLEKGETQRSIAEDYGVRQPAISGISSGKNWSHV